MDTADYIKEQYFLEVSSTGLEKVLRKEEHLQNNIGNEIEIKLKVDKSEHERILNLVKNTAKYKNTVKQIDTYYSLKDKNSWLRTRNENGKCIFNLKKKINNI